MLPNRRGNGSGVPPRSGAEKLPNGCKSSASVRQDPAVSGDALTVD